MAYIIDIPTFTDYRGKLSVIDKLFPFKIKRIFYIYEANNNVRGEHRHKKTKQALIAVNGQCNVYVNNGKKEQNFILHSPDQCLILEPEDWHSMEFKKKTVLLVLASHHYNKKDYIYDPY